MFPFLISLFIFAMTPDQALDRLKAGNEQFLKETHQNVDTSEEARDRLVQGQEPFATVLTCSDSRVPVELIFHQGLGEIFVVRLAGNVAGTLANATIDFGVEILGTPLVVVMGHEDCGAVKAAVEGFKGPPDLEPLMEAIRPAVEEAKKAHFSGQNDDLLNAAIQQNVRNVRQSLIDRSPTIQKLVAEGRLKIVGAEFHLHSGKVEWLED